MRSGSKLAEYIRRYIDLGWRLLPLIPGQRRPPFKWAHYYDAPPTVEQMQSWIHLFWNGTGDEHDVAVLAGKPSGIIVVDIDDDVVLRRFEQELFITVPRVLTRRGKHFYFTSDREIATGVVYIRDVGDVEIKGERSIVPLPPSTHPKNRQLRYMWEVSPWDIGSRIPSLPEFIIKSIDEHERIKYLEQTVSNIKFASHTKRTKRINIEQIIYQAGLSIKREVISGDAALWRLDKCPICGKREGSPWVMPDSGRLFDFRATCPASVNKGGMALHEWTREIGINIAYEHIQEEQTELDTEYTAATVDEARRIIIEALRITDNLIITVPPGVGKSTTTLEWLCTEGPRPALYSVPTLQLARELARKAEALTTDRVTVLTGRNSRNCMAWETVQNAHTLGYAPGEVVCPFCIHNPDVNVAAPKCKFFEQFQDINKDGIFFSSHILASTLANSLRKKPKIWIIDEKPHEFAQTASCPLDSLRTLRSVFPKGTRTYTLIDALIKLGDELHKTVINIDAEKARGCIESRVFGRPVNFGPWKRTKTIKELLNYDISEHADAIQSEINSIIALHSVASLFAKGVSWHALQWLHALVTNGPAFMVAAPNVIEAPITLRRSVITFPANFSGRVITLDATAYVPVIERSFDKLFKTVNINVEFDIEKVWVRRSVSKTSIARTRGINDAIRALYDAIKLVPESEQAVLFCHQYIKHQIKNEIKKATRENHIDVTHHFSSSARGVNLYANHHTVILLGLPVPNPTALFDLAYAAGLNDTEWEQMLDLSTIADTIQEIHRIRPILSNIKKRCIIVASRWPLKKYIGEPDNTTLPKQKMGGKLRAALNVAASWFSNFQFIQPDLMHAIGIGTPDKIFDDERREIFANLVCSHFPERATRFVVDSLQPIDTAQKTRDDQNRNSEDTCKACETPLRNFRSDFNGVSCNKQSEGKGVSKAFNIYIKACETPFGLGYFLESLQKANCLILLEKQSGDAIKGVSKALYKCSLFFDRSWWRLVFRDLRRMFPDAPLLEIKQMTAGGIQIIHGLGSIDAARKFYTTLFGEFDEGAWSVKKE